MAVLEQITKVPLAKKLAVLILLIVLVGVGYWFVYYMPVQEELESLRSQQRRLENEFKDAQRRKATYMQDQRRRDELRKTYAQQLRALPADTEMSSFLNSLNTQAELVGLEIVSVKPLQEEAAEYYARIPVSLKLSGSYHQLAKFFYLVGNLERVINIENITLKASSVEESGTMLSADVLATTFRSTQPSGSDSARKQKR
jgi:type IV pilus assembly protein PilO